jgi:hypothetical protein
MGLLQEMLQMFQEWNETTVLSLVDPELMETASKLVMLSIEVLTAAIERATT